MHEKKLAPLRASEHKHLNLLPIKEYRFASGELVAPIVIDEIANIAREYPIVFPVGSNMPAALMGVEKDANAYVAPNGQWLANYIPAHIRHHPFAVTRIPNAPAGGPADPSVQDAAAKPSDKVRLALLLDVASTCLSEKQGEPMFDAQGQLTGLAAQKRQQLDHMQKRAVITQRLVKAIEETGLLKVRGIRIQREGGAERQVTGVRVVDEAALNKLDDVAFNKLRRSGALPLVYASLLSWTNLRQGPIGKSHPLQAASAKAGTNSDDLIRFN